jgi:glycosyltransferase involved in cell wall biosynthesis
MQAAIRLLLQKAETLKSEKLKEGCSAPKDRRSEIGDRGLRESSNLVPSSATTGGRTLKFVMQWPENFDLPDGRQCGPDSELLKDERVKFSKDLLTGNAYWDFLQEADVIVLPYRSESYRARVSRVAIEAAILGKPMVYTKGTWISEVVAMGGAGVAIAEETPQSLAEAIQMAIGDLDMLQSEAECGVARVREFYSVSAFHHLLGEVGGSKKSIVSE